MEAVLSRAVGRYTAVEYRTVCGVKCGCGEVSAWARQLRLGLERKVHCGPGPCQLPRARVRDVLHTPVLSLSSSPTLSVADTTFFSPRR